MSADTGRAQPGFFGLELLDDRYPALHGLRVVAILSVIQLHVTAELAFMRIDLPHWFTERSHSLFFGMDGFFVLSGFLIGSILLRSIDVSGTQNLRRFYLRRVFRTFPAFYITLTTLILCFPTTAAQQANVIWEYLYLSNVGVMHRLQMVMPWDWSLSLEEQFYLAVPLLFVVLRRLSSDRARIVFLSMLVLSALFVRAAIYASQAEWELRGLEDALYFRTTTRYDTIVTGVLLAVVEMRYRDRLGAWLKDPGHRALLLVPAIGCAWVLMDARVFGEDAELVVDLFRWGTLTSLFYLAVVPVLLHGEGPITRFLSRPLWRRLATVGYGVYLVHLPILGGAVRPVVAIARRLAMPGFAIWTMAFALTVLLSFAMGYLMHILIEKPSLRIRDRIAG